MPDTGFSKGRVENGSAEIRGQPPVQGIGHLLSSASHGAVPLPIVHTLAMSFSSRSAVISGRVGLLPVGFSTIAYERILDDSMFIQSFKNSVVRVILGGGINLVLTILTAYPLSRPRTRFPQRNIYMWYIVFSMLFAGGIIPSYLLIKNLGLLDTIWVLVLPGALPIFNMLVLMNYFRGLPS